MMDHEHHTLQQILRIARSSRDFFVNVYPRINDAHGEVRFVFSYIGYVKCCFIVSLAPWVLDIADDPNDKISPAAALAKTYAAASENFRRDVPTACASALSFGEEEFLRWITRGYESTTSIELKELFETYYPRLMTCRDAVLRLRMHQAA
jgi:hypothetical protein